MRKYRWIAVALGSFVGGTALAQQTYDSDQPSEQQQDPGKQEQPKQPGTQPPQGEAKDPAAKKEGAAKKKEDAAKKEGAAKEEGAPKQQAEEPTGMTEAEAETSARLSQIESEGVRLSDLDQQQVMDLQQSLQDSGYYTGSVDGLVGPLTKQALRRYYGDQAQLATRGVILPKSAAALGLDEAEIERVRGQEDETGAAEQPERIPGGATDVPSPPSSPNAPIPGATPPTQPGAPPQPGMPPQPGTSPQTGAPPSTSPQPGTSPDLDIESPDMPQTQPEKPHQHY